MIEYNMNGAWGKTIPDEKLTKALLDFGISLKVEGRKDGLSNITLAIDDEKILKGKKKVVRKSKVAAVEGAKAETPATKGRSKRTPAK